MAKTIKIKHPTVPSKEETFLTAALSAAGTASTVRSNEGWAANDVAILGRPGQEQSEQVLVTSVSGNTTINHAAVKFAHGVNTPLFRSDYNQISVERKPTGGSFAVIAEGLQNIEWDEKQGYTYVDIAAGEDEDTYRWRFYNSGSGSYSPYSGSLPASGLTYDYAGYIIEQIRLFGKIPAELGLTDIDLLRMLNRGQQRVDTLAPSGGRWWFALTEDTTSTRITSIADTYKYDLTSNFRAMDVVKVLDENDVKINLSFSPLIEFDALKQDDADTSSHNNSTRIWTLLPPDSDNTVGYFGVHPTPEDASIYFYRRYWRFLPTLTSSFSQTLIPLPETLFNWAMREIYRLREDMDNANYYEQAFNDNVKMLTRLQRRQIGQAELVRFRGQRGYSRLFGEFNVQAGDFYRENYW